MIVAAAHVTALAPEVHSLKAKRKVIRSIKDRVKSRFNVSAAEVGSQDLWQRIELGFAAVGNDQKVLNSKMDKLLNYIESTGLVDIIAAELEFVYTQEGQV